MQVLPARRQEENYIKRYSKELINQNDKHLVNLCELNNFETQVILLNSYSELARTLFSFGSTNDLTNIK